MTTQDWIDIAVKAVAEGADTLIAALLGAAFAVVGVVLSNRANLRSLHAQHEHDRSVRKLEYELAAKREVYMQAAEAISAAMTAVSSFSHLDRDHEELVDPYIAKSDALAKVHVVATAETASHFMGFMRAVATAIMELSIERAALLVVRGTMLDRREAMKRHNASRDQYLELMRQMNLHGERDYRKWQFLKNGFEFEQDNASKAAADHDQILSELRPKHVALVKRCFVEQRRLQALLVPLVAAVRSELQLPVDVDAYSKVLDLSAPFSDEQIERLFRAGDTP